MSQAEMRGLARKISGFAMLRPRNAPGVRLASWLAYAHAVVFLPACLVTDPVDFEVEQGSPPMLIDKPRTGGSDDSPLNSWFWANKDDGIGWTFSARVRDEDVLEDLQLHWRIVTHMQDTPAFESLDILADGVTVTRPFNIFVEPGLLNESECHKLEIAVSGNFTDQTEPAYFGLALVPDDVARGVWWLLEGDRDLLAQGQAKQIIDTCDALDAPVVQAGIAGQGE
jgi:hypothetical protein